MRLSRFIMASPVVEQWEARPTLVLANEYVGAARELLEAKLYYPRPILFLVGHAIELGLKAFLMSADVEKQYMVQHRHDIDKLLQKAL